MVMGHCIQYGSGLSVCGGSFFYDPIFRFIYSFHMPLFMLISGFFFSSSAKKYSAQKLFSKRFHELFIPILSWSAVDLAFQILYNILKGTMTFRIFFSYPRIVIGSLWFLWAILFCSIVLFAVKKIFRNFFPIHILIIAAMTIVPDKFNLQLYKFMYPYFVAGFYWNEFSLSEKIIPKMLNRKFVSLILLAIPFAILYHFFRYESYIYTTAICILRENWKKQLAIDVFRWVIGFSGSIFVLYTIFIATQNKQNPAEKFLAKIGRNSMGIYATSGLFFSYFMVRVTKNFDGINYAITLLETVSVTLICYIATEIIKKIPPFKFLFLGSR